MDDWTEAMRAAAADPPPSAIDLDGLIRRETMAARRRRYALAGATTAVLVGAMSTTGLLSLPTGGAGPGGGTEPLGSCAEPSATPWPSDVTDGPTVTPSEVGSPSASPVGTVTGSPDPVVTLQPASPMPTEDEHDAIVRLSTALDDALAANLPSLEFTDPAHPNCERPQLLRWSAEEYSAALTYGDGQPLSVSIGRVPREPGFVQMGMRCADLPSPRMHCESRDLSDGSVAWVSWFECGANGAEGGQSVRVYRTDGTLLTLSLGLRVTAVVPSSTPSGDGTADCSASDVTLDQLLAIGSASGLTLYP